MKTLIILAVIFGVLSTYFVFNTEKSFSIKNTNGVVPAGIDVAKFILDKTLNQAGKINPNNLINSISGIGGNNALQSKITEEIKSKIGEIGNVISDAAVNLIKKPIENTASQLFCPPK